MCLAKNWFANSKCQTNNWRIWPQIFLENYYSHDQPLLLALPMWVVFFFFSKFLFPQKYTFVVYYMQCSSGIMILLHIFFHPHTTQENHDFIVLFNNRITILLCIVFTPKQHNEIMFLLCKRGCKKIHNGITIMLCIFFRSHTIKQNYIFVVQKGGVKKYTTETWFYCVFCKKYTTKLSFHCLLFTLHFN